MNRIKVILWDVDGTLLNFKAAQKSAMQKGFSVFGLGVCTEEMVERYSAINERFWKRLERGEISKRDVLEGRFYEFFRQEGLPTDQVPAFNQAYQVNLGDTICFEEGADELVRELKGLVKQYAVTNGTKVAQQRKLKKSGLDKIFDAVFISDEIGVEKPMKGFFDAVWERIGAYQPEEVLIVGDSLTSDMRGGNNAGILCCWYNPDGRENNTDIAVDHEIRKLYEVKKILGMKRS